MDYNELLKIYGRLLVDDHDVLFPDFDTIIPMVVAGLIHNPEDTLPIDMAITLLYLTKYPDATKYGLSASELLDIFPNTSQILSNMTSVEIEQMINHAGTNPDIYNSIANNTTLDDNVDDWIKISHIITHGVFTETYPHLRLVGKIPYEHQKKYISGVTVPVSYITIWVGLAIKHNLIEHISNRLTAMYIDKEQLSIQQVLTLICYIPNKATEIISLSTTDMGYNYAESGRQYIDRIYDILTDNSCPGICEYISKIGNGKYVAATISSAISLMKPENIIQLCTPSALTMCPELCVFVIEHPVKFDNKIVDTSKRSLIRMVSSNWSRSNMEIILDHLGNLRPLVLDVLHVLYYTEFMTLDKDSNPRRVKLIGKDTYKLIDYFMTYKPDMSEILMNKLGSNETFQELYKEIF